MRDIVTSIDSAFDFATNVWQASHIANIRWFETMATEPRRTGKTEVLSMRMDPKTRFMLEVVAKARGQSISTVVERAILEAADNADFGDRDTRRTWRNHWSLSEGERALNMAADQSLYPTYEDECRLTFTKTHWPFFYTSQACTNRLVWSLDILWPSVDTFLETWDATKATDYWAAGRAMQEALLKAGVSAPDWPAKKVTPPPPPPPPPARTGGPSWDPPKGGDLDDEIPF
jgi:hypothetical protein